MSTTSSVISINKKEKSIFLSAISGNILEYYDFTVYAVFSLAIGKSFFPHQDNYIQILLSLSVFAIGFLTRPIGGILFGYIADKYGRRKSLITSVIGMTLTTLVIGLIPNYQTIGFIAPLILVIMRLIQGLCISGEGAGAAIFILEHHINLKPGLTASIVNASNIAGTLIASLIGIIISYFTNDDELSWRIAFILGGLMGMISAYSRIKLSETPIFKEMITKKKILKSPFLHVIKTSWRSIILTILMGGAASSVVYLSKTYINIYYCNILNMNENYIRLYLAFAAIVMMLTMPVSGYLSDKIGKLEIVKYSTIIIIICAIPTLFLMSCSNLLLQLLGIMILAILGGLIGGCAYIFIISLFKPEERFSGVAFSYNLGVALFGGTSAAFSRILVEKTGIHFSPALYIIFTNLTLLISLVIMKKYIKNTIKAL